MVEAKRKETEDSEEWIKSYPQILGEDILIIGEQVPTKSGFIDFFGVNKSRDLIIVHLGHS